jgi:hypothetical protein
MKLSINRSTTMKSQVIVCAIAALSLSFGSLSFAQGYDQRRNDDQRHEQRGDQYARREQQQPVRGWQTQEPQRRFDSRDYRYEQRAQNERSGYGGEQRAIVQRGYGQAVYAQPAYRQSAFASGDDAVPVVAQIAIGVIAVGLIGQLLSNH